MPNLIADNIRHKILTAMVTRLQTIRIANGYNTQPAVSRDWMTAEQEPATYSLWVQLGAEEVAEAGINGRHTCAIEIHVNAFIRKTGDADLQRETNKLLQDVRNCIAGYASSFHTLIGTGGFIEFGSCETDEGALLDANRAWFDQTAIFQYNAGSDW